MISRAGLVNQDLEFVQFHPTGGLRDSNYKIITYYELVLLFERLRSVIRFIEDVVRTNKLLFCIEIFYYF